MSDLIWVDGSSVKFGLFSARIMCRDRFDLGRQGLWSALEDQGFDIVSNRREFRARGGFKAPNPRHYGLTGQFARMAENYFGVEKELPPFSYLTVPLDTLEYSLIQRLTPSAWRGGDIGVYLPTIENILRRHGWMIEDNY